MDYWEFLLQKEGDQTWLPLEASQVEILEGRYRMMAHTSRSQQPIEIRISQLQTNTPTPRRRLLKRQAVTNDSGLLVVMPFTWLQAGSWDISCRTEASLPDEDWHYAVQLLVLSQDSEEGEDWTRDDWPSPQSSVEFPAASVERTHPRLSDEVLSAAFDAIDCALADALGDEETSTASGLNLSASHRIDLLQSAFVADQGETLTLTGTLQSDAGEGSCPSGALALRLYDPQSGKALATLQHPLEVQPLPVSFSIPVTLPEVLETRLLLGELALVGSEGMAARVLAVQRFTVTVDLASLFDAIANQAESDQDLDVVFPPDVTGATEVTPSPDLPASESPARATDLPKSPPRAVPTLLLPRGGPSLPPKIYYPSPHEVSAHQPTLPLVTAPAKPKVNPAAAGAKAEVPAEEVSGDANPPEPTASAPAESKRLASLQLPPLRKPRPFVPVEPSSAAPDNAPAPEPASPVDGDFRALNLQQRFWSRLNALAVDIQQATLHQRAEQAAAGVDVAPIADAEPSELSVEAFEAEEMPFAGEVVIYEDDLADASPPAEAAAQLGKIPEADAEDVISPPTPAIELPEGDLIAGSTIAITLRAPYHANRLYLKVWITDPQTRTLADEPRQITHLTPDGLGNLESTLPLRVPFGCLTAQFEAIAVDMVTQQESYKATESRTVLPGDTPPDALDEFEI